MPSCQSRSLPPPRSQPNADSRVCFHCRQPGHIRPNCLHLKSSVKVVKTEGVTVTSKTAGDKSEYLDLKSDADVKLDAAPLKEHLSKTENPSIGAKTMLFLPMKVADVEVDAQIDTGSPVVMINRDVIQLLTTKYGRKQVEEKIQPVTEQFFDLQNNLIPLDGMIDVDFELNKTVITCPAVINLNAAHPVLIGLSFFERIELELSIPTKDGAVKWILDPERRVNGQEISIFLESIENDRSNNAAICADKL